MVSRWVCHQHRVLPLHKRGNRRFWMNALAAICSCFSSPTVAAVGGSSFVILSPVSRISSRDLITLASFVPKSLYITQPSRFVRSIYSALFVNVQLIGYRYRQITYYRTSLKAAAMSHTSAATFFFLLIVPVAFARLLVYDCGARPSFVLDNTLKIFRVSSNKIYKETIPNTGRISAACAIAIYTFIICCLLYQIGVCITYVRKWLYVLVQVLVLKKTHRTEK